MDIQGADYTSIGTAVSDLDSGYLPGTVVPTSRQRLALYGIILAEMSIEMVTSVLYQRYAPPRGLFLSFFGDGHVVWRPLLPLAMARGPPGVSPSPHCSPRVPRGRACPTPSRTMD